MNKKITILTILVLVLVFIALAVFLKPSFPRSYHHFFTSNTNLKNENMNGFYLFDNLNDDKFLKRYGKQTHKSQDNILYNYYRIQEGVEIATNNNGDILRFVIVNKGIPTSKGIEAGDDIEKAKAFYGKNNYYRVELGHDIIGYVDKKHHQSLEFWYDFQNKIVLYRLDDNSME